MNKLNKKRIYGTAVVLDCIREVYLMKWLVTVHPKNYNGTVLHPIHLSMDLSFC